MGIASDIENLAGPTARISGRKALVLVALAGLCATFHPEPAAAQDGGASGPVTEAGVQALIPEIEAYIASGMRAFDSPGLSIGIVAGDKLVYAKGFGVRAKGGSEPVDTRTVFQIGSATKAFLAATMGIMVDRKGFAWDDRVVDLDPGFQMKDPWVTREFRVFDLLAQRSGLPPEANDALGILGMDQAGMIRSLRHVDPVTSFRSTFAYTNITHMLAGRIVAKAAGASDWNAVLQSELLQPLGMGNTSTSAGAIEAAPNHAGGHRWTPDGTKQVPFTQLFPYDFGGAGDINSTIEDMARWLRLQIGRGTFEGKRLVSPESLAFTHTPKVAITEQLSYAFGWVVQQTPGGTIVWHNGGTTAFGSYVGLLPDRNIGLVVLTNETNVGFPDTIGLWVMDRILGNARVDHVANGLERAKAAFAAGEKLFAQPANPRPSPPLAPLAGTFSHPGFGKASLTVDGNAAIMELQATGARLKLDPWDGEVFTASLVPAGPYAAMAENLGPLPNAFVQFQIDAQGRLDTLRLSMDDGQAYTFRRD